MFEYDLFISYAHLDNEPLYGAAQGWIDILHRNLEVILAERLGRAPKIWRDLKLQGNDYFDEEICSKLSKAAAIVSTLSPSYINSEWCIKELQEFYNQASANGVGIEHESRIFKVCKMPVELAHQPEQIKNLLGYEFFGIDKVTKRIREFSYRVEYGYDERYWAKLEDMVQDIKKLIDRLNDLPPVINHSGKIIYLAETTSDLKEERDIIRRELQLSGHRILPDRPILPDSNFRKEASSLIVKSHLSVHLVGANYGTIPEGESKSIIEIQRELAGNRVGAADFAQIIWMSQENKPGEDRQKDYIKELNNLNLPNGSIIRESKLEDLKTLIYEKLVSPASPPKPQKAITHEKPDTHVTLKIQKAVSNNGNNPLIVYIVCDKPDYEAIKPIKECLFQYGFEIFQTDPKLHRRFLQACDAVLIYYGNTTDGWLQMKRIDLFKLRRAKPMLAKAFYITEPQTSSKEDFRVQDGIVIPNFGEFSCDLLDPFIEEIERAKGNRQ